MSTEVLYGPLPEGWERKELGDIAETQLGKMLNSSKQTGSALKPYLRNINLQWGRIDLSDVKEMDIFENEMKQFMLAKGDVLVCEGGEPGRSAVWNLDIEMGFQNAIHRIRPRKRLSPEFACYQFEWLVKNGILDELFTGVTIKHFSQQKLRKVEFVVPLLNEQEKIVEILEEQLSRLDAALASVREVREKSARFRRSLLHAAFTGALTGHDTSTETLPEGWTRVALENVLEDAQPGFACGTHNSMGRGVVHMRPMNVSREGNLDFSETKYVEDASSRRLRRGDVLFNNTNSPALIGKTAFVDTDQELAFSNHMTRLRPDASRLLANFLASQLHALWLDGYFEKICSNHVNQASVSTKRLKSVEVNFPSLHEQNEIVQILEEQLSRLDASLAVADAIEKKASALRRSLLHAAFNGNLTKEWREGAHV
jgi:type I restriction enzyme S subunit